MGILKELNKIIENKEVLKCLAFGELQNEQDYRMVLETVKTKIEQFIHKLKNRNDVMSAEYYITIITNIMNYHKKWLVQEIENQSKRVKNDQYDMKARKKKNIGEYFHFIINDFVSNLKTKKIEEIKLKVTKDKEKSEMSRLELKAQRMNQQKILKKKEEL
jgi:hypothetical protein